MDFYNEWIRSCEHIVPWVVSKDPSDFTSFLQFFIDEEIEENISPNFVPHSTFWLVEKDMQIKF